MMLYKHSAWSVTKLFNWCTSVLWYGTNYIHRQNFKKRRIQTEKKNPILGIWNRFPTLSPRSLMLPLGCLRNNRCKWVTFESTAFPPQLMWCENPSEAQQTYPWASRLWAVPRMIHFTILHYKEKTRQPPTGCITVWRSPRFSRLQNTN